jgi:hypothetical protein
MELLGVQLRALETALNPNVNPALAAEAIV